MLTKSGEVASFISFDEVEYEPCWSGKGFSLFLSRLFIQDIFCVGQSSRALIVLR